MFFVVTEWHRVLESELPNWSTACKLAFLIQPSSAAAKLVISLLSNSFTERQARYMEDYYYRDICKCSNTIIDNWCHVLLILCIKVQKIWQEKCQYLEYYRGYYEHYRAIIWEFKNSIIGQNFSIIYKSLFMRISPLWFSAILTIFFLEPRLQIFSLA